MAEGSGLLNRRTASSRTVSSNLIPSASFPSMRARRSHARLWYFALVPRATGAETLCRGRNPATLGGANFHPVGTCRMGHGMDAVVDLRLRVHGIAGLREADAPIMIGVKCAAMILEDAA